MVNQTLGHSDDGILARNVGAEDVDRLLVVHTGIFLVLSLGLFGADVEAFAAELIVEILRDFNVLLPFRVRDESLVRSFGFSNSLKMVFCNVADVHDSLLADADLSL